MDLDGFCTFPKWNPGTWYKSGEKLLGSNGRVQRCIAGGQSAWGYSAKDEPNWPEQDGKQIIDGSVVWMCEGFPGPVHQQVPLNIPPLA